MNSKRILVLGDGGWGTALALVLHHNGHNVTLWSKFPEYAQYVNKKRENTKFLPGVKLPRTLKVISELIIQNSDLIVMAVPTQFCRSVLKDLRSTLGVYTERSECALRSTLPPIVSVAKGIEQTTLKRPSEIVKEVLDYPNDKIAVLSGPSHAEEVARQKPASVVVASSNKKLARDLQAIFSNEYFRVYTQDDVVGVETAAAVKNIIAIAAGICDGLGYGTNTRAALITRGLAEMTRLGLALGAQATTFMGLSGLGDLVLTATGDLSRNRQVGLALAQGQTLAQATAKLGHYLHPGKELRGGLVVKPISIPEDYEPTDKEYHLINEELVCGHLVPLNQQTYKHRQGHLALLCGQKGMLGAGLLAGRASLRSGCGLATLCIPEADLSALVSEAPELMTRPREQAGAKWLEDYQALVIGCGLGRKPADWKKYLSWMKKAKLPSLLDADAFHGLTSLKGLDLANLVATPHQGEFCHFMGLPLPQSNGERIEQGRAFIKKHPCVLVLKGAPTLVFSPQGAIYVNETGNAGLATAGTGDVLAGLIGGFLAQGYQPLPASLLGVWLHGFAAELYAQDAAQESLTSTELLGYLGRAMAHLQASLD